MRGDCQEDATGLVLDHPLACLQGEVGGAAQHDVHYGLEGVGREALGGGDEVSGGVVDHHGGLPQLCLALVDGGSHRLRVANVALNGEDGIARAPAQL